MDEAFQVGDRVRVARVPAHISAHDYPFPDVQEAFAAALGNTYPVESVDWGGWVRLNLGEHGTIGVQPDCVELVERN